MQRYIKIDITKEVAKKSIFAFNLFLNGLIPGYR